MTNAKHTPGPWGIDRYVVKSGDDEGAEMLSIKNVCRISQQPNGHKQDETDEANARLIAAAPELLEALERAADELHRAQNSNGSQWLIDEEAKARAAIAKATGKGE